MNYFKLSKALFIIAGFVAIAFAIIFLIAGFVAIVSVAFAISILQALVKAIVLTATNVTIANRTYTSYELSGLKLEAIELPIAISLIVGFLLGLLPIVWWKSAEQRRRPLALVIIAALYLFLLLGVMSLIVFALSLASYLIMYYKVFKPSDTKAAESK